MSDCQRCSHAGEADAERTRIFRIHALRISLAAITNAHDATNEIVDELDSCPCCIAHLATAALDLSTQALTHMAGGSRDAAAQWIQRTLAELLDQQEEERPQ